MANSNKADPSGDLINVLAKKLAATKEGTKTLGSSLTLKALRRSLARAAADLCELPLGVIAARQANAVPEDLTGHLSDRDLLIVLDGPNGRVGAASLDAALVTALIQQQTMGQVLGLGSDGRNYTPTDAAMMAEFLERTFEKVTALLDGEGDSKTFAGYKFGAQIDNVRNLVLGLEGSDYRVIRVTVDLAGGMMQGELVLVLPEPKVETDSDEPVVGRSLGANMHSLRAELSAVLCRVKVPLNEFASLKIGDSIPLDHAFLYETHLLTIGGQNIAQGRLGQINGSRAIRLVAPGTKPGDDLGNADGFGSAVGPAPGTMEPPTIDLEIAGEGLDDPSGLGGFGGDLGGGLDGGLGGFDAGGDLPGLGGDLPPLGDLADDLGGDLGELPPLGGDLGDFNPDTAAAEISELAGLGDDT
ncbi:FliM/FliN family flagellar motor C-terminal domain-containing protein [Epibacterium ulvae]|uniref:flagellar motor switch protein FliM n=1 Tax=Epibacterium ulvae TaxID=1156985 RepID=UPI001BFCA080|nr:flagellar motor switch protein FliM [Epibacterium ulvae]MBT8152836.1 FliM/FliN family flagellar motor C-terminal domain-containing protein [Epibacterium ulvae]